MPYALQDLIGDISPPGDTGLLDEHIKDVLQGTPIEPKTLKSLIDVESHFDPNAKSKAGAVGLTQLMPETAKAMGVTDRTDPYQSIEGGGRYLTELMNQFKTLDRALAAYHQGPAGVPKGNRSATTNAYVDRVLKRAKAPKVDTSPFSTVGHLTGLMTGERPQTTALEPEEEGEFNKWFAERAKNLKLNPNPDDPRHYYDSRGAWKAGYRSTTGHLPDIYKLPGHPSFSDESQYYRPGMRALKIRKQDLEYFQGKGGK